MLGVVFVVFYLC